MQSTDVLSRSARSPDLTLTYGPLPGHVADLWLPPGDGTPHAIQWPLIVFLHGGFWRSAFDRKHVGPLAEALAAGGFAVCCPEYRRVGQEGGGWPGTFDDIRSAVAVLPDAVTDATDRNVDLARVVLAGHSAGGHLALWAASRLAAVPDPVAGAVVSLAGVCNLADCYRRRLGNNARQTGTRCSPTRSSPSLCSTGSSTPATRSEANRSLGSPPSETGGLHAAHGGQERMPKDTA